MKTKETAHYSRVIDDPLKLEHQRLLWAVLGETNPLPYGALVPINAKKAYEVTIRYTMSTLTKLMNTAHDSVAKVHISNEIDRLKKLIK